MDYWPPQTFTAETVNQVDDVEGLSVGNVPSSLASGLFFRCSGSYSRRPAAAYINKDVDGWDIGGRKRPAMTVV
jgi:hypothetical protein